jgi:transcriptional regulator GlxA family with amidase domain
VVLRDVVAVVGDQVAAFELGVVAEVFGLDRTGDGLPGYRFAVCAVGPGAVPTTSGFAVHVEHGLDRIASADLVAVPSWPVEPVTVPPALLDALVTAQARGARLLAVCSGSFLLAEAGLLDGRRATTHWRYASRLALRFPRVVVDAASLYVQDGQVVTSAGTSAAIDACLHVVRQEQGVAVANAIARRMVAPPHRSGGQAQYVEAPVPVPVDGPGLAGLLEWVQQHLAEPLTVAGLAGQVHMSPRTFARRFGQATGTTPHRWVLQQRLLLAERLLEDTDLSMAEVARRSGLGTADTLRHHFAARRRLSPGRYRSSFRARADVP